MYKMPYLKRKMLKFAIARIPDDEFPLDRKEPKFMYAMGQI